MSQVGSFSITPIAHICSDFPTKFGIPRQSGLVPSLKATIVFEPDFAVPEAVRGLQDFSHIWLIWGFSEAVREGWSPTVRPPRLGGNTRMGVFATRSPFRPNNLGLSSVKLDSVELSANGAPVLHISGADLLDGTPIYDIKPYLPTTDCHPEAVDGFVASSSDYTWLCLRMLDGRCLTKSVKLCGRFWRKTHAPPTSISLTESMDFVFLNMR